MAPVSTEMADRVQSVADTLAKLGATVSDVARPNIDFEASFETYNSLLWGVMGADTPEEEKEQMRQASKNLPEDPSIVENLARFTIQEHGEWLKYSNDRFRLRNEWDSFFKEWDILICPQMPTDAFLHDHGDYLNRKLTVNNEDQDYFQQVFWAGIITVAHLPSTIFPTGPSKAGLPIGLQAVGAEYNDLKTIDFTRLMAQEIGGFTPPPNYP